MNRQPWPFALKSRKNVQRNKKEVAKTSFLEKLSKAIYCPKGHYGVYSGLRNYNIPLVDFLVFLGSDC